MGPNRGTGILTRPSLFFFFHFRPFLPHKYKLSQMCTRHTKGHTKQTAWTYFRHTHTFMCERVKWNQRRGSLGESGSPFGGERGGCAPWQWLFHQIWTPAETSPFIFDLLEAKFFHMDSGLQMESGSEQFGMLEANAAKHFLFPLPPLNL